MTYRDDAVQLARALAALLNADPPPAALTPRQTQAVLVCRDTVLGAVRDLTGAVLQQTPLPLQDDPELLARSPVHALHAALRDLPVSTGRGLALTDALRVQGGPAVAGWQAAARAATVLETYRQDAAALPGPAAWSLARDLAAFSTALPALDLDLAAALTGTPAVPSTALDTSGLTTTPAGPVGALLDGPSHGLLQLAALELSAHTTDVPPAAADLAGRFREPIRAVRHLSDLPAAGRQLADLVDRRGSQLTITEVRVALQVVVAGIHLTADALDATGPDPGLRQEGPLLGQRRPGGGRADPDALPGRTEAAGQLRQALPDLQLLVHEPLAALTRPAPGVLVLSQQIQAQLVAAGRLAQQQAAGTPTDPRAPEALQVLSRWAVTTAPLLQAVRSAVRAATDSWALFAPRQDAAPGRHAHLLWLPVQHTDPQHPALQAVDRAATTLGRAAASLTDLLKPGAAARPTGTQRAAADAAAAFGELAAALASRPPQAWPNPTRTSHPAVPRAVRQSPRR